MATPRALLGVCNGGRERQERCHGGQNGSVPIAGVPDQLPAVCQDTSSVTSMRNHRRLDIWMCGAE